VRSLDIPARWPTVRLAREHMHVEVPDVLATAWFVVLAHRCSFASVGGAGRACHDFGRAMYRRQGRVRNRVDVLVVVVRDDQNVPRCGLPPLGSDKGGRQLITEDDVCLLVPFRLFPRDDGAERTCVLEWRMRPHGIEYPSRLEEGNLRSGDIPTVGPCGRSYTRQPPKSPNEPAVAGAGQALAARSPPCRRSRRPRRRR
jgi:hypothetical protein